jgi:hypothetical protein
MVQFRGRSGRRSPRAQDRRRLPDHLLFVLQMGPSSKRVASDPPAGGAADGNVMCDGTAFPLNFGTTVSGARKRQKSP